LPSKREAPAAGAEQPRTHEPSDSVTEALDQARHHGRAAIANVLAAIHALLDAAALATAGEPARAHRLFAPLAGLLEGLEADLGATPDDASQPLLASIADALDAEIARWEALAEADSDARAVLRAFLGLRELLWEFGVRRKSDASGGTAPDESGAAARRRPRSRVQRVPVEG
jgi:hypothetical protein